LKVENVARQVSWLAPFQFAVQLNGGLAG